MNITIKWDNLERTSIRCDFPQEWTWDDFYSAYGQAKLRIMQVRHPVNIILNMTESSSIPSGALAFLRHLGSETIPMNMGYTVVVSHHWGVQTIWDAFRKVYQESGENLGWQFAASLEDARTLLGIKQVAIAGM